MFSAGYNISTGTHYSVYFKNQKHYILFPPKTKPRKERHDSVPHIGVIDELLNFIKNCSIFIYFSFFYSFSLPAVYRFSRDPLTSFYYEDLFPYATPIVYALALAAQVS